MKFYLLTEFALVSMMFVCSLTDVNSLADLPIMEQPFSTEYRIPFSTLGGWYIPANLIHSVGENSCSERKIHVSVSLLQHPITQRIKHLFD